MAATPGGIKGYARTVRAFSHDMRLYILFTLIGYLNIGVFQVLYNLYLNRIGLQEDFIGTFTAVNTIAIASAALAIGPIVNRYGPWIVVVFGFTIFCLTSIGLTLSSGTLLLLAFAALQGIGTSFFSNPTMLIVLEYTSNETRQHASAIVYSSQALSATLGNLGGGLLPKLIFLLFPALTTGSVGSYRATLMVGVLIAGLALIPLLRMRPSGGERRGEMAGVRRQMPVEAKKESGTRRADFYVFIISGGLLAIASGAVVPFYNVFLKRLGASTQVVGYIYALAALVAAVVGLTGPVVAAKFGALRTVGVLRISPLPLFVAMIFVPHLALAIPAHALRVTSINMSWPIDSTFIADLLPARQRAYVFSIRSVLWNAGWAITSIIMGRVIRATDSYAAVFVVYSIFLVLSVGLFQMYFQRRVAERARLGLGAAVRASRG
ncbi:MAG: MFS transporter [Chloroflexota bacterium]|nr:MFS transporter [Chloroflexota bacterium]MDQ6908436.1 MFS transporter [Chloroflexota bacterium]